MSYNTMVERGGPVIKIAKIIDPDCFTVWYSLDQHKTHEPSSEQLLNQTKAITKACDILELLGDTDILIKFRNEYWNELGIPNDYEYDGTNKR